MKKDAFDELMKKGKTTEAARLFAKEYYENGKVGHTRKLLIERLADKADYPKEDLREWIFNNFEEVGQDLFSNIAEKYAEENEWDVVEAHLMVEEMVEKVKEGLLHIIDTCDA